MSAYFDQMVLSATPVELVRLLFQKAVSKVREARVHLKEKRIEERAAAIGLAYSIVAELMNSLDSSADPALTQRLKALYCYTQERLVEANLKQIDKPLADALAVLGTMSEAWGPTSAQAVTASAPRPSLWANNAALSGSGPSSFVLTA
ncbi:MAG: flagellar export chaperone FliS [Terriglobia bacterium]